jgi:S-layer homology domain.
MNNMRPPIAAILAALLLLAWLPAGNAKAAERADTAGHWAEPELTKWLETGDLRGYADGSVKPDQPITRAEWIALTNRAFYYEGEHPTLPSDTAPGAWYASAVSAALAAGYIEGGDNGAVRPEAPITRQEAAAALSRIGHSFLEAAEGTPPSFQDEADRWAEPSIASVAKIGWMNGYPDGTFAPLSRLRGLKRLLCWSGRLSPCSAHCAAMHAN